VQVLPDHPASKQKGAVGLWRTLHGRRGQLGNLEYDPIVLVLDLDRLDRARRTVVTDLAQN
jgi:hypothetical protein